MVMLWRTITRVIAGLMGASGVALAALAAHRPGSSDLAIAAQFLLIHAAAILGCAAQARDHTGERLWLVSAGVLAVGTVLFGLDLALIGLFDSRPVPLAAPIGGAGMVLGWLFVVAAAVLSGVRRD